MKRLVLCCVFSVLAWAGQSSLRADEPLPENIVINQIMVEPTEVSLTHKFDYRQLLITGQLGDGQAVDITRLVQWDSVPGIVTVSANGVVRPVANGSDRVKFSFRGKSFEIPVQVAEVEAKYAPSFVRDVQPVFSRLGCNQGTCHGAKEGKGGFKLSLRGYDAIYDYRAFTDEVGARRFNRVAPDQSLMLLKASGAVPHVGGQLTKPGEPYYELVRSWIANGVKFDLATSPKVKSIEVFPRNPVLPLPGMKQQVRVVATYTDGATRDVSKEAFVESGNIEVLTVDADGTLNTLRRGEAPILVRYEGAYAVTTLTVMGDRSGFAWSNPPTYNFIDELVYNKLQKVKVVPSELCTDAEFIRRVYFDLTGLPPTPDAVRAFLADGRPSRDKRDELVDQLVGSPEFVEHWTNKWADLLQVNRKFLGEDGAVAFRNWIKDSFASNKPYDQFAYEILTASGSNVSNPAASYYKILREPADVMENTTHLFLAVRFNCNKCHDHPFERWTQDQYYHLAAYFTQVGRKTDPMFQGQTIGGSAVEGAVPLVEVVFDSGAGEMKHDRTGQVSPPEFPYQHNDLAESNATRREQIAKWMTSAQNQYFAKSLVNRLWGYMFGVGIIEPIDDIRAGNPPTNPELLSALESEFIKSGFDMRHVMKLICKSRVYQQSVVTNVWNEDDGINFSHALPRRLPAEVLYDAFHFATGTAVNISGAAPGVRAEELPDGGVRDPFLDDFGRPVRESACECERSNSMALGPVMKLVNGPALANALTNPENALTKLVRETADDKKLIEELFLRFLSRYPTEKEIQVGIEALYAAGKDVEKAKAELAEYEATLGAKISEWEASLSTPVVWQNVEMKDPTSAVGATFEKQADGSFLVGGNTGKDTYTVTVDLPKGKWTGIRLEVLPDAKLPMGGPGRAMNGNMVLNELRVQATDNSKPNASVDVKLANANADFNQESWSVAGAIDGNEGTGWAVSPRFNEAHEATFEFGEELVLEDGGKLTISMSQQFQDGMHLIGKFRFSATGSRRPFAATKLPDNLAKLIATPATERNDQQKAELKAEYTKTDTKLQRLAKGVNQAEMEQQNQRLIGAQDLAWALVNNPSFLFNR